MDTLFSDLTIRQYAAIGKVACEWGHLEMTLLEYFMRLTKINTELSLKITSELGSQTLLNMISAITHDANKTDDEQPELYKAFMGVYHKITELRGKRNRAIHLDWVRKGRSKLAAIYFTADGKLRGHPIERKTSELEQLAKDIFSLNKKLWEILLDHEAGKLVALPPISRKQPKRGRHSAPKALGR